MQIDSSISKWIQTPVATRNNLDTTSISYSASASNQLDLHYNEIYKNLDFENKIYSIFISKCNSFRIKNVSRRDRECQDYPKYIPKSLFGRDKLVDKDKIERFDKALPAKSYIGNERKDVGFGNMANKSGFKLKEMQVFNAELLEFNTGFNFIEPIFCTGVVYADNKIINDEWNFAPKQTKLFFEKEGINFSLNDKVAFHYKTINKTAYLLLPLKRIVQQKNGVACNQYYWKDENSKYISEALNSLNSSWPVNNDIYSVFAFTYVLISDLLASPEGMVLPKPIEFNDFNLNPIDSILNGTQSFSGKTFNIDIKIKMEVKSVLSEYSLIEDGYRFLHSLVPLSIEPSLRFNHFLILTLHEAKLKLPSMYDAKSIFVSLSYQTKTKEKLNIIYNPFNNSYCKERKSTCSFNLKNPSFNDVFLISLPQNIEKDSNLILEFYTVNLNEKSAIQSVATAKIPLYNQEGKFIQNGTFKSTINFNNEDTQNGSNKVIYNIFINSSLIGNSALLYEFLNGDSINYEIFEKISPNVIVQNLFLIINKLMHSLINDPENVIKSIYTIYSVIIPIYQDFEEFLLDYVLDYALIDEKLQTPKFHKSLLIGWMNQLKESGKDNLILSQFFFLLIIKSVSVTKDKSFEKEFDEFIKSWNNSILPLANSGFILAKNATKSFAQFIYLLFDIGFYSMSLNSIISFVSIFNDTPNEHQIIIEFLKNVLQPKLFIVCMYNAQPVKDLILNLIKKSIESNSVPLQQIFYIIINICSEFENDDELTSKISFFLIDSLKYLVPLSSLMFFNNNNDIIHPSIIFFSFIISHILFNDFKEWWIPFEKKKQFYESLHFILNKIKTVSLSNQSSNNSKPCLEDIEESFLNIGKRANESKTNSRSFILRHRSSGLNKEQNETFVENKNNNIFYSLHFSIINIIRILAEINILSKNFNVDRNYNPVYNEELSDFSQITKLIYHILCDDTSIDCLYPISQILINIAKKQIKLLFTQCCPILPKLLYKLITQLNIEPEINDFIETLYSSDLKYYNNNNRANAIFTRTLSLFTVPDNLLLIKVKNVEDQVKKYIKIINDLNKTSELEEYGELLYNKFLLLNYSPDAQIEVLSELSKYHQKNEYYEEEIQVLIMQASIILEYLVRKKVIKCEIWNYDKHSALVFEDICSSVNPDSLCPDIIWNDFLNDINSFCDSQMFNQFSLIKLMLKIVNRCRDTGIYEIATFLFDHLWPLLEKSRSFFVLRETLLSESEIFSSLSLIPTSEDRLFGHYFRVSFYGSNVFENPGTYIYREKKLTHLYEFSARLKSIYEEKYGKDKIEFIKESSDINISNLDQTKGYIQITFINPFLQKLEQKKRHTLFEQSHNLTSFCFDIPFVQGKSKAQGSIDQQMLLRTIINTKFEMPYILKRQRINESDIKKVIIQPIRVSYRQLRERITMLHNAIERNDIQQIQQLIHGSLLVQVNEGPSKMAEIFLKDPDKNDKYVIKLKNAFHEFLEENANGLKIHAKWVIDNPEFVALQQELESGFNSLKEKLSEYI